jgi:upstream-binding transcription factor
MLKAKDEEIEMKGKEQQKMKMELKKLQKLKEFKPTMVRFLDFSFLDFLS